MANPYFEHIIQDDPHVEGDWNPPIVPNSVDLDNKIHNSDIPKKKHDALLRSFGTILVAGSILGAAASKSEEFPEPKENIAVIEPHRPKIGNLEVLEPPMAAYKSQAAYFLSSAGLGVFDERSLFPIDAKDIFMYADTIDSDTDDVSIRLIIPNKSVKNADLELELPQKIWNLVNVLRKHISVSDSMRSDSYAVHIVFSDKSSLSESTARYIVQPHPSTANNNLGLAVIGINEGQPVTPMSILNATATNYLELLTSTMLSTGDYTGEQIEDIQSTRWTVTAISNGLNYLEYLQTAVPEHMNEEEYEELRTVLLGGEVGARITTLSQDDYADLAVLLDSKLVRQIVPEILNSDSGGAVSNLGLNSQRIRIGNADIIVSDKSAAKLEPEFLFELLMIYNEKLGVNPENIDSRAEKLFWIIGDEGYFLGIKSLEGEFFSVIWPFTTPKTNERVFDSEFVEAFLREYGKLLMGLSDSDVRNYAKSLSSAIQYAGIPSRYYTYADTVFSKGLPIISHNDFHELAKYKAATSPLAQ